jgi:hypothetical protein
MFNGSIGNGDVRLRNRSVAKDWKRLRGEELRNLYFSPNVILVIKSRRGKWIGHVARVEEKKFAYRILVEKTKGKNTFNTRA